MIHILIVRELKARYRGTALGFLWSFVNPLILMAVYALVFSVYLRMDMEHYPAFLLCGILPWTWFASGLNEGVRSIVGNGGLIKKVYLPSEIFPLVSVGSNLVHYLLSVPILLGFLLLSGLRLSWLLLLFPWILAIQFLFTYSVALIVAAAAVQFRDMLHIVPNVLMMWFFLTPVFYPITMVPEKFRALANFNPMAAPMVAYQDIFFYNRLPSMSALAMMTVLSCVLFVLSLSFFEGRKGVFAEEV